MSLAGAYMKSWNYDEVQLLLKAPWLEQLYMLLTVAVA